MINANWAVNKNKLERALKVYPEHEEKCKELYIALGGLVKETTQNIEKTIVEPIRAIKNDDNSSTSKAIAIGETNGSQIIETISQFKCKEKECKFIGKNDKSLRLHFLKKHNVKSTNS